jgi:hypothetical protein
MKVSFMKTSLIEALLAWLKLHIIAIMCSFSGLSRGVLVSLTALEPAVFARDCMS